MEIINKIYSFPQDNLNLLRSKTFLKPLIKLMIRDALLSEVELDDEVTNQLCDKFFKRLNIDNEEKKLNYFKENLLNQDDKKGIATSNERAKKMSLKLLLVTSLLMVYQAQPSFVARCCRAFG